MYSKQHVGVTVTRNAHKATQYLRVRHFAVQPFGDLQRGSDRHRGSSEDVPDPCGNAPFFTSIVPLHDKSGICGVTRLPPRYIHELTLDRYGTTFAGWLSVALVNTLLCQYFDFGLQVQLKRRSCYMTANVICQVEAEGSP